MAERIPRNGSLRVALKAYLSSDNTSEAIGQTVFVQINKNMAGFTNPSIGTYGATESGYGWYYFDLSPTDVNTAGPLIIRGTVSNGGPTEITYRVDPNPLDANVLQWNSGTIQAPNITGVPLVDVKYILGATSQGQAGYVAPDWNNIVNPTATVSLPNTIIGNVAGTIQSDNRLWKGGLIPTPVITGVPIIDMQYTKGTASTGKGGYVGTDWGQIANPATILALSNTTISPTQSVAVSGSVQSYNTDKTGYSLTSPYDLAKTAAQPGDQMSLVSSALGSLRAAPDVNTDNDVRASFEGQFRGVFNRFYDEVTQDGITEQIKNDSGVVVSSMSVDKDTSTGLATRGKSS